MKIEIKEYKGLLTYKIDGSDLPMNSAIREYKHPSDIDAEGWSDIINESNGDTLEVTYIGSEMGYKQAISQAPQVSNTFILNFIDEFNQKLKLFQNNFEKWVSRLEKSRIYELASDRLNHMTSFADLKERYYGLEFTKHLNEFGNRLLNKLIPENCSLDELLSDQRKRLEELTKERKEIAQKISDKVPIDGSDTDDSDVQALMGVLGKRDVLGKSFESAVAHIEIELNSFQEKMNKDQEELEDDDAKVKIDGIYNQMLNSLQDIVKEFLSTGKVIDKDDNLMDLTDEILENISTGMVDVESIDLTKGNRSSDLLSQKLKSVEKKADQLISDGKANNHPSSLLVGNTLRLMTYLAEVRKEQLDERAQELLDDRKQKRTAINREKLKQKLDEVNQKIAQENKKNENLLSVLEFKRSMPIMPVQERNAK